MFNSIWRFKKLIALWLNLCELYHVFVKNSTETLDLVNKKVYNEYTNIDKLIYQIN